MATGAVIFKTNFIKSALYFLKEIEYLVIFVFFANKIKDPIEIRKILYFCIGGIFISALLTLGYYYFFMPPNFLTSTLLPGIVDPGKFPLGAYYFILSLIALVVFLYDRLSPRYKIVSFIAVITGIFFMIATTSRTAFIMTGVVGILFLFDFLKYNFQKMPLKNKLWWGISVGIFFTLSLIYILKSPVGGYLTNTQSFMHRIIYIWGPSLKDVLSHSPIVGLGKGYIHGIAFDSIYIKILTETGIIGFIFYFAILINILKTAIKSQRSAPHPIYLVKTTLIKGIIALLVGGIFAEVFVIVKVSEIFWMLAGLLFVDSINQNKNILDSKTSPIFK